MRKSLFYSVIFLIILSYPGYSQTIPITPEFHAVRISDPPSVDGYLDEKVWEESNKITDFRQRDPDYDTPPRFDTEVRIIYDNKAIYIGAIMYDPYPDSIKRELGVRDNDDLNADFFGIGFDTYKNKQDAYLFAVTASGVQIDSRQVDETYDAVWASAVKITGNGWNVELRIPYSALRFPAVDTQEWGMQIIRSIRRNREEDYWTLEPKDADNNLNYWGTLKDLKGIDPPLRLSILPYLSAAIQHNSAKGLKNNGFSTDYNGGMDIKWGLNESFTLDMILLPDFSQVQSDEIEKNLSPFEIVYDENRPFFNEGTDLFQKGNLFYSRRIGHVPLGYYSAYDSLNIGEAMVKNPTSSTLLNAVKISGRTSSRLGIGVFNALTGNTYAVIGDTLGNEREVLTDPLTNYNIIVLDQNLPNNSSVYLINSNVTRPDGWKKSNVAGAGFKLGEKSNSYQLKFDFSVSTLNRPSLNQEIKKEQAKSGIYYNIEFTKIRGNFRFSIYQLAMDKLYDKNDLGVNMTNDWLDRGLTIGYNIFQPFGKFRYLYQSINLFREEKISSHENVNTVLTYRFNTTLTNYLSLWGSLAYSPEDRYDYYEPRRAGRYWINTGYKQVSFGFSSDYRKVLALDGNIELSSDMDITRWNYYSLQPIIRFSDRFKLYPQFELQLGKDDKGFVNILHDSIYFGIRDIQTIVNSLSGEYKFSNKISLSMWVRHYWQKADYEDFLYLDEGGQLNPTEYSGNYNYNYNSFNIDLVFGWEFSPGSMMNIVWKNAIQNENPLNTLNYFRNFDRMISSPQINNLSIKLIYYLDYQMLRKNR
ncbi:MAG TPA: DUF5916 domain-containing protein [Lentimicrobium sp.]|nr:DUF5916 domain-containing protein [Lentimicrobium sp.]